MATLAPKILSCREFDRIDELEVEWQGCYQQVLERSKGQSDSQLASTFTSVASATVETQQILITGLIYGILVDKAVSAKYLKVLGAMTREQYGPCVSLMKKLVCAKFHRLLEPVIAQCIWLIASMIGSGASEADGLVLALIKHIVTGNTTVKNLTLISQVLDICTLNRDWLYDQQHLIPVVVYTFTSIITDHHRPQLDALREREVSLVVQLIREKFEVCRTVGRDLVRVLYNISLIPDIKRMWEDVIMAPSGPGQPPNLRAMCHTPTPKHILASRLSPETENWLKFIFTHVKKNLLPRYQAWFAAKYLATAENEALVPDLIRWICGVHHPPNHILQSDIAPRFLVLGWLLSIIKTPHVIHNSKQALFYDWLFFVPGKDNIMNIEPAALLLVRSLPQYVQFVTGLSEYLLNSVDTYLFALYPPVREDLKRNVHLSAKALLDKKVLLTFDPLYTCPQFPQPLKDALRKVFEGISRSKTHQQQQHISPPASSSPTSSTAAIAPTEETSITLTNTSESTPKMSTQGPSTAPVTNGVNHKSDLPSTDSSASTTADSTSSRSIDIKLNTLDVDKTPNEMEDEDSLFQNWKSSVASSGTVVTPDSSQHSMDIDMSSAMRDHEEFKAKADRLAPYQERLKQLTQRMEAGNSKLSSESFSSFLRQFTSEINNSIEANAVVKDIATSLMDIFKSEFQVKSGKELIALSAYNSLVHTQLYTAIQTMNKPSNMDTSDVEQETSLNMLYLLLSTLRIMEPSWGPGLFCHLISSQEFTSAEGQALLHQTHPIMFHVKNGNNNGNELPLSTESAIDSVEYFAATLLSVEKHRLAETRKQETLISATWSTPYLNFLKYLCGKKVTGKVGKQELEQVFLQELQTIIDSNLILFNELVPYLCRYLTDQCIGNTSFIRLVITHCLPHAIAQHTSQLSLGHYELIGDQLVNVIRESLAWDSYSQQALWNIIASEFVQHGELVADAACELLIELNPLRHYEALVGFQLALATLPPSKLLLEALFSLPLGLSQWVATVLSRWNREEDREWNVLLIKFIGQSLNALGKGVHKKTQIRKALMHIAIWLRTIPEEVCSTVLEDEKLKNQLSTIIHANCPEPEFEALSNECINVKSKGSKDSKDLTEEDSSAGKKRRTTAIKKRTHQEAIGSDDEDEEPDSQESKNPRKSKRRKLE